MNVIAHGIDLIQCDRIATILARHEHRFLQRILTQTERNRASRFANPIPHIAGRFAAKEAILKMLGTGWRGQIAWTDMEITNDPLGQPIVTLTGECDRIARQKGINRTLLSITHTADFASASIIGTQ
jgi:holo-[acyl-carrier protein] synthase